MNQRNTIRVSELYCPSILLYVGTDDLDVVMDTHFRVQYGQKHDKGGHSKMCWMKKT